ncbi:TetR/AcrR family transcriptional regulator [Plantactinospora siamensis]|uniref:TetR/AcrR family transcriptional regulator n=1 Tax=Plantactinospora siamensis TaxID=555372 RepID=A0ABV6P2T6_9ACTN
MPKVADRRVRRTRASLAEALTELILQRGYEAITVQDLLDRADIGRSTFYAHFRDKEDLLLSCFDDLRAELRRELDELSPHGGPPDPAQPSIVVFAHAYRHRRIYRALCGRGGGTVVPRHLHALIGDALRPHLAPHLAAAGATIPVEVVAEFYASGLLGVLTWWVGAGFPHGPAELARMYGAMANPGVMAVLGHPPS